MSLIQILNTLEGVDFLANSDVLVRKSETDIPNLKFNILTEEQYQYVLIMG